MRSVLSPRVAFRFALLVSLLNLVFVATPSAGADADESVVALERLLERARDLATDSEVSFFGEVPQGPPPVFEPTVAPPSNRSTTTDWTPYTGTFALAEAAHLLHRSMIGPQWFEFETAVSSGLLPAVDGLLAAQPLPASPGSWDREPVPDVRGWTQEMIDSLLTVYYERQEILRLWWPEVMIDQQTSVTESMVLFWSDHFATGMEKVLFPQSMYIQNDLFRQNALGNFRELTRSVAYDPAMLLWLDGQVNRRGNVNENWGRELLELFTLGVDQYTQQDVVMAARSFTGYYTPDGVTSYLNPAWHDTGLKIFLGQWGPFDGDDIIDIIFQQDETSRFICRKLYRWFIDEFPDETLIEELAQTLRDNDYEVEPVVRQILLSEHFFDQEFAGSTITDGVDHYCGLVRSLGMAPIVNLGDYTSNQAVFMRASMFYYGQILFEPPNVAGWPGYRTWVNSYTLPWRKTLDVGLIDAIVLGFPIQMQANVKNLALQLQDPNDPYLLIADLSTLFFGFQPTELVANRMLEELLQGAEPWEWNVNDPNAVSQLRGLFRLMMRLPDFQLK